MKLALPTRPNASGRPGFMAIFHIRSSPSASTAGFTKSASPTETPPLVTITSHSLAARRNRSEEHTSELQSLRHLVCRLLLEKKKTQGLELAAKGKFGEAEPRLQHALARPPQDVEVIRTLALCYLGVGLTADAEALLSRWCVL